MIKEIYTRDSPIHLNGLSLAIGFHGIAETCYAMFGYTHTNHEDARNFAYKIVKRIREKADKAKEKYQLNFSCYATPKQLGI